MKKITLLLTLILSLLQGFGQADDIAKAKLALQRLARVYQQAQLLSFDLKYTYAREETPAQSLDSMSGQCRLHGNRYWSSLDNTESVYDSRLLLMLFKEDSMMYLTKPGLAATAASPVAMLDSFFLQNKDITLAYAETAGEQLVSMTPQGSSTYKKITYHIDRKTGYLNKMVSLVKADQLYDPSVRSLVSKTAVYVLVEAVYSHYQVGAFDESVFDLDKYFKKEASGYVAQAPYEKYKVFLGTTGL